MSEPTTATTARPVVQAGDSLGHYCATHIFDAQCERNRSVCRAFCGHDIADQEWDDDTPECLVCAEMCEERGDFDLQREDSASDEERRPSTVETTMSEEA